MEAQVLRRRDPSSAQEQRVVSYSVQQRRDVRAVLRDGRLHGLVALTERPERPTERVEPRGEVPAVADGAHHLELNEDGAIASVSRKGTRSSVETERWVKNVRSRVIRETERALKMRRTSAVSRLDASATSSGVMSGGDVCGGGCGGGGDADDDADDDDAAAAVPPSDAEDEGADAFFADDEWTASAAGDAMDVRPVGRSESRAAVVVAIVAAARGGGDGGARHGVDARRKVSSDASRFRRPPRRLFFSRTRKNRSSSSARARSLAARDVDAATLASAAARRRVAARHLAAADATSAPRLMPPRSLPRASRNVNTISVYPERGNSLFLLPSRGLYRVALTPSRQTPRRVALIARPTPGFRERRAVYVLLVDLRGRDDAEIRRRRRRDDDDDARRRRDESRRRRSDSSGRRPDADDVVVPRRRRRRRTAAVLLHRAQHREEAQRRDDRAMRDRVRRPRRRPRRRQGVQHVRVQGRVEPRRLSPLPVAPRRARGAHGAAASREEDNGRGDHGRRGRDRRAAFRGEHRVHHGERGRRADGCAKGDMRRLRVHPPGALPRREARRGEAADALARRPTRRALSLSLSLYIPATQCATSPYPISCRTRADRSNQIAPFASDANDSTASAPRVSTSPSPRRS